MKSSRNLSILILTIIIPALFVANYGFCKDILITDAAQQAKYELEIATPNPYGFTLTLQIASIIAVPDPRFPEYTRIRLQDAGNLKVVGKPMLPVIREVVQIPEDCEVTIDFQILSSERVYLSDLGIPSRVVPRQPPRPKTSPDPDFVINEAAYRENSFHPQNNELVKISRTGRIRGTEVATLEITPVQYNPSTGEMIIISGMEINIGFPKPLPNVPNPFSPDYSSPYFDRLKRSTILNYSTEDALTVFDLPIVYLVIAGDDFTSEPALADFAEWKSQKGFSVAVVSYSDAGGSLSGLTNFISNAYSTWENPPQFILLVGDFEQIPAHEVGGWLSHYTDLYYVTVDGTDFIPDIMIGRISVQTVTQLEASLYRIIEYEKTGFPGREWLRKPLFMACGTDGDWELAESTHRYVFSTYLTPLDFAPDSIWAHSGSTGADITASINAGNFLANYSGHGDVGEWANPPFDIDDVEALSNDRMFAFVLSNACLTGKFDESTCFGEAWVRTPNKGAIAFLGGSNSTLWDEDDVFERKWYDAIFEDGLYTLQEAIDKAKLELMLWGTSEDQYYYEIYNLLGDPSMSLYWGTPDVIDLSSASIVPVGVEEYEYSTPLENALMTLWMNGEVLGQEYTPGGSGSLVLDHPPTEAGNGILTLTAPNYFETLQETLLVQLIAQLIFSPGSLLVGAENTLVVYVDSSGYPMENITVNVSGLELDMSELTDDHGEATFVLTPSIGEILEARAIDPEIGTIAIGQIPVIGGTPFGTLEFSYSTPEIFLEGSFAVGFTALFRSYSPGEPYSVALESRDIDTLVSTVSGSCSVEFAPSRTGEVLVTFAREGCETVVDTVLVIAARGPLNGTVTDDSTGAPIPNVTISLFPVGVDTVVYTPTVRVVTDSMGFFSAPDLYPCAWYDIYASHFSFEASTDSLLLNTVGGYDIALSRRPSGTLLGTTSPDRIEVLFNWVGDGNNTYRVISTDGTFELPDVIFQTYVVYGYRRGYRTYIDTINVSYSPASIHISLEDGTAEILVVDRDNGGRSAEIIKAVIEDLGYSAELTDEIGWVDELLGYNLLIWCGGGNSRPFGRMDTRRLERYRNEGGKLLFEGGELIYQVSEEYSEYGASLFYFDTWEEDFPGELSLDPRHFEYKVFNAPTALPEFLPAVEPGSEDYYIFDAYVPTGEAFLLCKASECAGAGCASFFGDENQGGIRRVGILGMNIEECFTDDEVAGPIIENSLEYLLGPLPNITGIYGFVNLSDTDDNSGVKVYAISGADSQRVVTDELGRFCLYYMEPGEYDIVAHKHRYADTSWTMSMEGGEICGSCFITLTYTGISQVNNTKPGHFKLGTNYPNPFNSTTLIPIDVPARATASLVIFDVLGNVVHDEEITFDSPGVYEYRFDCRDQGGEEIPSGIYFYRFESGDYSKARKLVIMR